MLRQHPSAYGSLTLLTVSLAMLAITGCSIDRSPEVHLPIVDTDSGIRAALTSIVQEGDQLILTFQFEFENDPPDTSTTPSIADLRIPAAEASHAPVNLGVPETSNTGQNGVIYRGSTPVKELEVVLRSPDDLSEAVWIEFPILRFLPEDGPRQDVYGHWEFNFIPDNVLQHNQPGD